MKSFRDCPEAALRGEAAREGSGYQRVRASGIYDGIDLLVYSREGAPEYDFEVAPGADPGQIALRVRGDGRGGLTLRPDGSLSVETAAGPIVQAAPWAYQRLADGVTRSVDSRYQIGPGGEVRFALGPYDPARPLVIDPLFIFSTYMPGIRWPGVADMATDGSRNLYVVGSTTSTQLLIEAAIQPRLAGTPDPEESRPDFFVMKLRPEGTLIYSTYLGGVNTDSAVAVLPEADGSATVIGSSASSDFPLLDGGGAIEEGRSAGVLVRLSPDGLRLTQSRLLGLPGITSAIRLDSGDIAVAGLARTGEYDELAKRGFQKFGAGGTDTFVASVSPDGDALRGFSYLGGAESDDGISLTPAPGGDFYADVVRYGRVVSNGELLGGPVMGPREEFHTIGRIAGDCSELKFQTPIDNLLWTVRDRVQGRTGGLMLVGRGAATDRRGERQRKGQRILEFRPDGQGLALDLRSDGGFHFDDLEPAGGDFWVLAHGAPDNWFRPVRTILLRLKAGTSRLQVAARFPDRVARLTEASDGSIYMASQTTTARVGRSGQSPPAFLYRPISVQMRNMTLSRLDLAGTNRSGRLFLDRELIDFGVLRRRSIDKYGPPPQRRTLVLRNVGKSPLEGWISEAVGRDTTFVVVSGAGPYRLARGESREIVIEWQPDSWYSYPSGGRRRGWLSITSTDPANYAVRVDLSGKLEYRRLF